MLVGLLAVFRIPTKENRPIIVNQFHSLLELLFEIRLFGIQENGIVSMRLNDDLLAIRSVSIQTEEEKKNRLVETL